MPSTKHCPGCDRTKNRAAFYPRLDAKDGLESKCRECRDDRKRERVDAAAEQTMRAETRVRRLASDTAPLKIDDMLDDDYDVGVGNVNTPGAKRASANASRARRQEFNEKMGGAAGALRSAAATAHRRRGDVVSQMPADVGAYIGALAEQERRFRNRRLARTVSLAAASEALQLQMMKQVAAQFFRDRIRATGYAARPKPDRKIRRTLVLLLSDLHLGAELSSLDEPTPFGAIQEARRLEYVMRQAIDYKPQYRENTRLVLAWNGDMIEGQLGHQIGAGAPLAEQKAIAWTYFRQMIAEFSAAFPEVHNEWQSGNHGRDKVRHEGRATWRKWDGHEYEIGWALREMCSGLPNVTWSIPFRAVSKINLHGAIVGMTHADTELLIGPPDTKARQNSATVDKVNAIRLWGDEFAAWLFGHYHSGRIHYGEIPIVYNGMLIPPNGHARSRGYVGDAEGQFMFEAVEGFPIGDVRFIRVGKAQDEDERLGTIIKPFRFPIA